jgi:predicted acetyltransferase
VQIVHEFEDLNYKFSITKTSDKPEELHAQFIMEMSAIDDVLIRHYLELKFEKNSYFILSQDDLKIGYANAVEEHGFLTIYEIFILSTYRELGFGTKIFNEIKHYSNSVNLKIRSVILPSDRTGKNFYESNLITARALIMEEKRENSRYRP